MLNLKTDKKNLLVIFNGKTALSFPKKEPIIWLGLGEDSFKMSRGSFKFGEKVKTKKAMYLENASYTDENIALDLTDKKSEIKARLTIKSFDEKIKITPEIVSGGELNRMWIRIPATQDEHIYGCGETFTKFDLRGEKVRIWVAEHQNASRIAKKIIRDTLTGSHPNHIGKFLSYESYYAQPTFVSSEKYFVHIDADCYMDFDFTGSQFHELKIRDIAPFYIGFGESFEKLSENLTELLGRQPTLPEWAYDGTILGVQGGTEELKAKIDTAEKNGVNIAGVWCQDWEGARITAFGKQLMWNWQWDSEWYKNLDKELPLLHEKGIRFLGYINPFLAIEKDLYKQASEKGYCVKDSDGKDYLVKITTFPAAMVDLTNPDAYEWIKNVIKTNMIGFGLSGWMADFSEYLPTDCVLFSGEDAKQVHNTWPERWAKVNREAIEETGNLGKIFFFTRAGYTKTVKYSTLMWNGDQHVDWSFDDGLPSVIPATLSLAVCGFGLCHSDIGGYTTFSRMKRSDELFMRWAEMSTFSPVLRGHEGNKPDSNVQFDSTDETLSHYAKMSRIHYGLKDYLISLDLENSLRGIPVMRPLFYYYDKKSDFSESYEYLLGRDLLIAPVLEKGQTEKEVYLPDDEWVNLWNGYELIGGTYKIDCPLGKPPVFCRKQSKYLNDFLKLFKEEQ